MKITNLKLGQILIRSGVLTEEQLRQALEKQKETHRRLGEILMEEAHITEMQMIRSLEQQLNISYVDLSAVRLSTELSFILPENMARNALAVPIKKEGQVLTLAVADPLDYRMLNDIGTYTQLKMNPKIAERAKIETKIRELYTTKKAFEAAQELAEREVLPEVPSPQEEAERSKPIIRFVNNMIEQAVLMKASDIHIEPQEKIMRIRFRVDGHLMPYMEPSVELHASVVSRIKFIGGMNIAEKRVPQDGRISYRLNQLKIDLRISILPGIFGEKVVVRITTALGLEMKKERIGFLPENLAKFDALLHNDHGIILLTGPTGSGKSTTLYTAIKEIQREDINLITVEDPVEMVIPNITQVEINEKTGLTFGAVLRSILRQDPDVVMVGEIRDRETAEIATSMAITGHLVLSTLHTYDAASATTRLADMGVEPFLLSSALLGVISQRLVRVLCSHCKEQYVPNEAERTLLEIPAQEETVLYHAHAGGCVYCNGKGYKGRTAVHEIMPVSSAIRRCITKGADAQEVYQTAVHEGMLTMDDNLKRLVRAGETSMAEITELRSAVL